MSDFDKALANLRARRGLEMHGSSEQPDSRALIVGGGPAQVFTALRQTAETQARSGGDQKTSWVNVAPVQGGILQVTVANGNAGATTMICEFWRVLNETAPVQRSRPAQPKSIISPAYPQMQWRDQIHVTFSGALTRLTGSGTAITIQGISDYTLELLDAGGATMKQCTQHFVYLHKTKDDGMGGSTLESFHDRRDAQIFDTNPGCAEVYGLRLTVMTDGTPDGTPSPRATLTILDGQI